VNHPDVIILALPRGGVPVAYPIAKKLQLYRNNKPAPDVNNKIVILVDDGIATGATMRAAIAALKNQNPKKIIIAIPVADQSICDALNQLVDDVICLYRPGNLMAVGYWYEDFDQMRDDEVITYMKA
jgi:putative phosphoribosyl transferase